MHASHMFVRIAGTVSVLFSEPKIPQSLSGLNDAYLYKHVSVLFSEPKIPQLSARLPRRAATSRFSALQRAENSSMRSSRRTPTTQNVSVLFSEPKIPQLSARFSNYAR